MDKDAPPTLRLADRGRLAWLCAGYVLLHLLAHVSADLFEVAPGISIWYAPCGLAVSFLVIAGNAFLPVVFFANLATAALHSNFAVWWAPFAFPLLIATLSGFAAWVTARRLGGVLLPGTTHETFWFIAVLMATPAAIAVLGSCVLLLLGYFSVKGFPSAIFKWWIGDVSGLLTVVPAAMVFARPWFRGEKSPYALPIEGRHPLLLATALGASLIGTLALVFAFEPLRRLSAFHLCLIPLIWIAVKYGLPGATLATLTVTMGGLVGMHFFQQSIDFIGNFFLFEIAVASVGLGLGCAVTARHRLELKRLEDERRLQQMQKYESLGMLAGGIAHEFNNLLTAIVGNASLLRLDLASDKAAAQPLSQIESASWRAAELCQQMLAYAGRTPPSFQPVDLSQLIEKSRNLLGIPVGPHIGLEFRLSPGGALIEADASQLRQLLTQLVVFAADSIGDRPGRIFVSTTVVTIPHGTDLALFQVPPVHGRAYLMLEVRDNGRGIPLEVLPRLFDPFFNVRNPAQGLGLAALLGIVKAHQGALSASSTPGEGSRFLVYFPVQSQAERASETPNAVTLRPSRRDGFVLVVDDEENVRSVVCRMMENLGFRTLAASSGWDALRLFQERRTEILLVLLDLRMPHMDGEEVFNSLSRSSATVPVILMSGYSEKFSLEHFRSRKPDGFLAKPFDSALLRFAIERIPSLGSSR